MLACFQQKALVAHVLKGDHFLTDLLLRQLLTNDGLVLGVVWAVDTTVDTVVGEVERCKEHDTIAVDVFFDLFSQTEDAFVAFGDVAVEQDGGFTVREALEGLSLVEDRIDQFSITFVFLCPSERGLDFFIGNEFFCNLTARIVHVPDSLTESWRS